MLTRRTNHLSIQLIVTLFLISMTAVLAACRAASPGGEPSPTPQVEATSAPTNTPQPSPTSTETVPLLVLLAPEGADAALAEALQAVLEEFAAQEGLRFQLRSSLTPSEVQPEVKLVVILSPDPGAAALAAAAPGAKFLAVGIPGLEAAGNLSMVGALGRRPDQTAFAAGYLAAVITADWRVGVVSLQDAPAGKSSWLGFSNGVYYFCGLCRPAYPPFPNTGYPVVEQLADGAGEAEWQAAVSNFQTWQVSTVYVAPEVAAEGLLRELSQAGIHIIGTETPTQELTQNWVASIRSADPILAVQKMLPALLAGEGEMQEELPLSLAEVNPDLFSPGRQEVVESMLADLQDGYIDTGVDPLTGESRFDE